MANLIPYVVEDFSGGITDFYIGGEANQQQILDNMLISGENRDAFTRPGFRSKYNVRVFDSGTIRNIIDHRGDILLRADKAVKYVAEDVDEENNPIEVAVEIKSPQNHSVFTSGDDDSLASFTHWNQHTLGAIDSFAPPVKIYKDENENWKCTTLGLPEIIFPKALELANELKAKFNAHIASGTEHTVSDDEDNVVTSPDATDAASLVALTGELLTKFSAHQADANLSADRKYHGGQQTADRTPATTFAPETVGGAYLALVDLKAKYNAHDADSTAHATGSQFQSTTGLPTITPGDTGSNNYIYAAHFTYRYSVGDSEFIERGTTELIEVTSTKAPDESAITISNIPVLASGSVYNWDDDNIKISLYRTINNGAVLYHLADIDNGTTTYVDSLSDAELQLRPTAYTEGGILDNDMPPPCKFIEQAGSITAFAHVKEGNIVRGYRVRLSKPDQPYSSPEDFYFDFEDEITAFSSIGIYFIAFLKNKFYRLEGGFDSFGRGGYTKREISSRIGCIAPQSIIKTKNGLYFAAEDGFYFTDGYNYKRISSDIRDTYRSFVNPRYINGAYYTDNNLAVWTVQTDPDFGASDKLFIAHLDLTTRSGGHPFSTWSGGRDPLNFRSSAVAYINGEMLRADSRGYLLHHSLNYTDDSYVDLTKEPKDWGFQTIHYNITSVAFDFGYSDTRKWVSKIVLNAENKTSLSLSIESSNDRSDVYEPLKMINKRGNVEWGDPTIIWGVDNSAPRWNYFPVISEWRHMPAVRQALRCTYKQIRFTNAYIEIDNSSYAGPCSITPAGNTAVITLLSAPTNSWLVDAINYYISFEYDNYENEYLIIDRTDSTLTVADNSSKLVNLASTNWKIRGYRKREVLNLLNYALLYQLITRTQATYRSTTGVVDS